MPDSASTAQITYTTNPLLSPTVLGGVITLLAAVAGAFGIHVLDDPALQQTLVVVLGLLCTAVARYFFPQNEGRLSFFAPFSTPAPQSVPVGSSVVTVPAATSPTQRTDVLPLDPGRSTVVVPPASLATVAPPIVTATQDHAS